MIIQRALVLPDMQIRAPRLGDPEGEWTPAIEAVARYAEDHAPWDHIVHLGDLLDLPYLSTTKDENNTSAAAAVEFWQEDRERARRWLRRFGALSEDKYLIQGNHEYRARQYIKKPSNRHLRGMIDIPGFAAEEEWKWVNYEANDEIVTIGKANFGHGCFANQYHAAAHARQYPAMNFFYGHCHDDQSYTPSIAGCLHPGYIYQSCGCLCNFAQPWKRRGKSGNWVHMFLEFHFFENGNFTFYPIRLYNDRFVSPDGKWVYEGKR